MAGNDEKQGREIKVFRVIIKQRWKQEKKGDVKLYNNEFTRADFVKKKKEINKLIKVADFSRKS